MNVLGQLLKLTFPIECASCGRESDWLCPDCCNELPPLNLHRCATCGKAGQNGLCQKCQAALKIDGLIAFYPYSYKPVQRIIQAGKYHGQYAALEFLARQLSSPLWQLLPAEITDWAAVPMHKHKLTERGYNQSLLLGKKIVQERLSYYPGLVKAQPTLAQAGLEKEQRLRNIRKSMSAATAPENIVLFDDVVTTGATLKEAARVLRRAGSKTIWAVTVAHS